MNVFFIISDLNFELLPENCMLFVKSDICSALISHGKLLLHLNSIRSPSCVSIVLFELPDIAELAWITDLVAQ